MKLGELLKEKREQRNLTLRQVENKLKGKNINYSHTSIKRLENEEHEKVPIKVLSALAEIFNLNKIEFFNLAGAAFDKIDDDRVLQLNRREKLQREKFLEDNAVLFCNSENVAKENQEKLVLAWENNLRKKK